MGIVVLLGTVGAVVLPPAVQTLTLRTPLSGTSGGPSHRLRPEKPLPPGPSHPGNRADWTRWQVEFAFLGKTEGTMLALALQGREEAALESLIEDHRSAFQTQLLLLGELFLVRRLAC